MRDHRGRLTAAFGLLLLMVALAAGPAGAQAASADMGTVALTMSGGSITAGGTTNLNLVFENRGPGPAPNARSTVTFNQPVTISVGSSSRGSCSGGSALTCTVGSLPSGQRVTVQASVRLGAGATGNLTATARSRSDANDPNGGNDQRQATLSIRAETDLALSQSISPNPPQAGGNATVRPTVTNRGPSDAQAVVITVNIPGGVSLISASGSCSVGGSRLTCNLGSLAAGASSAVQVTYGLGGLPAGSQIIAAAQAHSGTPESNNGNNSLSQAFTIGAASADVSIRKSANPNPVSVGATVTFSMVVSNGGPSDARGVTVTDAVPAGLRIRTTQAPAGCSPIGLTVICNVGSLGAGASATVTISATVLSSALPGPLVNRVSVSSDTADRNPSNNSAEVSVRVVAGPATTRPTTPNRPTVLPTEATNSTSTTLPGELPRTGGEGTPFGVASMFIGLGVVAWAVGYRLRTED